MSLLRRRDRRHEARVAALVDLLRASSSLTAATDPLSVARSVCESVQTALGAPGASWEPDPARIEALRLFSAQAGTALDQAEDFDRIRFLADHDSLTGLPNRRSFMGRLAADCARCRRYERPFTLVLCDLDRLKELNDGHGHQVGDAALVRMADALRATLRASDGAFRVGGDEFALVLVEAGATEAAEIVERLRETLSIGAAERLAGLDASFGIAVFEAGDELETLLQRADAAMYEDKRARRSAGA